MIKIISIFSILLFISLFTSNYNGGGGEEKIITFSCSDNPCTNNDDRCVFDEPIYMLNGVCVKEGQVIDSLTPGAIKGLRCSCEGCEMIMSGTDNMDDFEPYLGIAGKYWIDDSVWKKLEENVLVETGNATFEVSKIESVFNNIAFTALNFTYLDHHGKEKVAIIPMDIPIVN